MHRRSESAVGGVTTNPPRAVRRALTIGLVAVLGIMIFAWVSARPVLSAESELREIRDNDLVLGHIVDHRATIGDWQVFIEPQFSRVSSAPLFVDPLEIAEGTQLATLQATQATALAKELRSMGLGDTAREIESSSKAITTSLEGLGELLAGKPKPVIDAAVTAERLAYVQSRAVTAAAGNRLREVNERDIQESIDHLGTGRATMLVADLIAALAVVGVASVIGRRGRRRERFELDRARRQNFETMLQQALEMSKTEAGAYRIVTEALAESTPHLQVEMLVADSSRAHFHQVLYDDADSGAAGTAASADTADTDPERRSGCGVTSPLDCPATMRGHTLVFPSSRALNACPYLKGRASGELSAACIAVSLTGNTVGVVHATARDGEPPGELSAACIAVSLTGNTVGVVHATARDGEPPGDDDVRTLEITARRAAERIAMLRAFEKSEAQARTDPLTGLWNRRSLENRVHDLYRDGTQFSVAYGDLDHFKGLNDTHGHEAGDQALRVFARVLRDAIRPSDFTARWGGEEFLVVLPDCTAATAAKVLERLRERLALTLGTGRVPSFTVSFGVASSLDGDTFDDVVAVADGALLQAKANGRNRTVMAGDAVASISSIE